MLKDLTPTQPKLARVGKIRLGYMLRKCPHCQSAIKAKLTACTSCRKAVAKPDRSETYPTSADHFVLDDAPAVAEAYQRLYGTDKPTRLNIWFPFDAVEDNLPSAHKLYSAMSVLCIGDGEHITHAIDPVMGHRIVQDGVFLRDYFEKDPARKTVNHKAGNPAPCPGYQHDYYSKCKQCKAQTTIKAMIREVPQFATFDIVTQSVHNHRRLYEQLLYFTAPREEGGLGFPSLRGVPFILSLTKSSITVPNLDKKGQVKPGEPPKKRVDKYLLSLEIDAEYMRQMADVQRRLASPEQMFGLPAVASDFDSGPDVDEDFDQQEIVIESVATEVRLSDLTKLEFFGKVKKDLGIPGDIAGWLALRAGLVNGTYDPGQAEQIWGLLGSCQPLVAFVRRAMEQVPGFAKPTQVLEAIDDYLTATDVEGGVLGYEDDLADELLVELNKVGSRLADEAVG